MLWLRFRAFFASAVPEWIDAAVPVRWWWVEVVQSHPGRTPRWGSGNWACLALVLPKDLDSHGWSWQLPGIARLLVISAVNTHLISKEKWCTNQTRRCYEMLGVYALDSLPLSISLCGVFDLQNKGLCIAQAVANTAIQFVQQWSAHGLVSDYGRDLFSAVQHQIYRDSPCFDVTCSFWPDFVLENSWYAMICHVNPLSQIGSILPVGPQQTDQTNNFGTAWNPLQFTGTVGGDEAPGFAQNCPWQGVSP